MALLGGLPMASGQHHEQSAVPPTNWNPESLTYSGEKHLKNVRQLTFGGDNAEAYWSFNSRSLVFQSNHRQWGVACDQIFMYSDVDQMERNPKMLSTGRGRTTCAYFMPGDGEVLYASTHHADDACPPEPKRTQGRYVWPVYESFDVFVADTHGTTVRQLTHEPGYDAEATVSPKGDRIVFTSDRSGDLELYTMKLDGSDVRQITFTLGYDGGAFFSPDGEWLVWRASRPQTIEEQATYRSLLAEHLVQPNQIELFVARADGSEVRQITQLGGANWAPYFTPDGKRIIFSSNHASPMGYPFNLYMVNLDGTGLEQLTTDKTFDSFPMFSPDGKRLVWASNRNNGGTRDTNLFLADWVD